MKLLWLFIVSQASEIKSEKNEGNLIAPVAPFAPPSKSVVEHDEPEKKESCTLDKDGKPPRPRMILLGETGICQARAQTHPRPRSIWFYSSVTAQRDQQIEVVLRD